MHLFPSSILSPPHSIPESGRHLLRACQVLGPVLAFEDSKLTNSQALPSRNFESSKVSQINK